MDDVEPSLFLFFSNLQNKLGVEVYHPLLVRGPISVVGIDGCGKSFFRPMVFGDKVVVNKASCGTRVDEGTDVSNMTKRTVVEGNRKFHRLSVSTSYKDLSNVGG